MNQWNHAKDWRRRLMAVRGMLVTALGLLFLLAELQAALPLPALQMLAWLALLLAPTLIYLSTRSVAIRFQSRLLTLELLLDQFFFLALLHQLGGSTNPLAYYLLVPVVLASLAQPLSLSILQTVVATGGYGLTLHWHMVPGADTHLHSLTQDMHATHALGMWLAFVLIAVAMTILGQLLRQAQLNNSRQQANALELALQRERMYQVASTLADRAHELNTPLSSLLLMSENLASDARLPEPLHADMLQLAGLAKSISQQLKPTTPDSGPKNDQCHLSMLIEQLQLNLRHLAPIMKVSLESGDNPILSRSHSWQRVLNNLGYNACDAGAHRLSIRASDDERQLLVIVSDDGPRQQSSTRSGMGIGLVLVESSLAAIGAELSLEFRGPWTQARITLNKATKS